FNHEIFSRHIPAPKSSMRERENSHTRDCSRARQLGDCMAPYMDCIDRDTYQFHFGQNHTEAGFYLQVDYYPASFLPFSSPSSIPHPSFPNLRHIRGGI